MKLYATSFFICMIVCSVQIVGFFEHDRGVYAAQRGDWESSVALLKKAVVDNESDGSVLYDAGVASFHSQNFKESLAYFTAAAQADTSLPDLREKAYFNAGNVQVKLEKLVEALSLYDKALNINPGNEQAQHNYEIVKKMLEQQQEKEEKDNQQEQDKDKEKNEQDQSQDSSDKQQQSSTEKEQKEQDGQQQQEALDKQGSQVDQQEGGNQDRQQPNKQESPEDRANDAQSKSDRNQDHQKRQDSDQHEQPLQKKDKDIQKKEQESQPQQDHSKNDTQEKQGSAGKVEKNEKEDSTQKIDSWLAQILQEQEKRDAQLNKQIIKAQVGKELAGAYGQKCW